MLVSFSAFDFGTPRWLAWIGCVSAGGLAAIFLLQAASTLIGNESFSYFTNEVLGFWPEKILLSLITFWLIGMLLTASRGRTRILGFVAMAIVVCVEAYVYFGLLVLGTNAFLETAGCEAAVSPAVRLASLRERQEAHQDGSVGRSLPAPQGPSIQRSYPGNRRKEVQDVTQQNPDRRLDFEALRLGIESCEPDLVLGFYADDARLSIVNADTPHASPFRAARQGRR